MSKTTSIGFIPLRKNSKGIRSKNKRKLLGRPLFTWVLTEAIFSELDQVYIFTDDQEIIDYVGANFQWSSKVICLKRSEENASDSSSTEAAIMEFCDHINVEFDIFCLLQATSPLTTKEDINNGLRAIYTDNFDASLSVVRTHRFIWSEDGKSLNYDYKDRPRRQDFQGLLVENGAVYCTTKKGLLASSNRLSGKIAIREMPEDTLIEIDTATDWKLAEQLLIGRFTALKTAAKIDYLVLDVDGVFTTGEVAVGEKGELFKTFDMRDGMGLEILREQGVQVMVMTSENSKVVAQRMRKLKIDDVYLGIKDKYSCLKNICNERDIAMSNIAYMGDDLNDLSNLLRAGWSICPANATKTVKYHADLVLSKNSGAGAIREAVEFIMNYNLRFNDV